MNFVISGLDFLQDLKKKKRKSYESTLLLMLRRGFLTPCPASPAAEVHLITPQVDVAIGKHSADFFKELGHEGIGGVQDGVHRPKRARKL